MIWAITKFIFLNCIDLCQYTVGIQVELWIHYVLRLRVMSLHEFIIFAVDLTSAVRRRQQQTVQLSDRRSQSYLKDLCCCHTGLDANVFYFFLRIYIRKTGFELVLPVGEKTLNHSWEYRIPSLTEHRTHDTQHFHCSSAAYIRGSQIWLYIVYSFCTSRWGSNITFEL